MNNMANQTEQEIKRPGELDSEVIKGFYQKLLSHYDDYFSGYKPGTFFQKATYTMLERAVHLIKGVCLLFENGLVAEEAIVARTMMNLNWLFIFLIDAKFDGKTWTYESEPGETDAVTIRAKVYMDWVYVIFHRMGRQTLFGNDTGEVIKRLKTEFGYKPDEQLPKCWHSLKGLSDRRMHRIKDIACAVGPKGVAEYDEDYALLSGVEHSDISGFVMQSFGAESDLARILLLKSVLMFGFLLDAMIFISKRKPGEDFLELTKRINEYYESNVTPHKKKYQRSKEADANGDVDKQGK